METCSIVVVASTGAVKWLSHERHRCVWTPRYLGDKHLRRLLGLRLSQKYVIQPFGNRRLMHCVPASSTTIPGTSPTLPHNHSPTESPQGEIPAWESCGRIVEKERADFYEFFACNLFIAVLAIAVLLARTKRLQALQARQLAARIGLVRSVPAGWSST